MLRPAWLPNQVVFPEPSSIQLIDSAYTLASACVGFDEEHSAALTALLLMLKADAEVIATGLLVRAYRQQKIKAEEIGEQVSSNCLALLRALDALSLIDRLHEQEKSDLEQLRKMLLAMASDMRAVILKLALQVLAMRGLSELPLLEQQRLALQTRDLFAPLANRLGIAQFKWELEDRALRVLEPDIYHTLAHDLEEKRVDRERYIARIIAELEYLLKKEQIDVRKLYGRVKHINSIYQKMKRKKLRFEQVNDVRAVRVEVGTTEECYRVLSLVHARWQPIAEEFDDYIVAPKANGYQSLHTSVIANENRVLEIQIRTTQMHEHAELGVAAHWIYKEKGIRHTRQFEQQIEWLRRMLDGMGDSSRGDVMFDQFKNEAFADRVYAVSPQGKVVDLPEGATPLDFAYHIHTDLGHRCRGAKINGKIVSLTTALKNGDSVEILTHKVAQPSRDWLNDHLGYLYSSRAKAKVRNYFRQLEKENSVEAGKEMLERECRRLDIVFQQEEIQTVLKHFNVGSSAELYAKIGFGEIGVLQVIHEIQENHNKQQEMPSLAERIARIPLKRVNKPNKHGIEIEGVEDLLINFASCCQPAPPADITGFITKGRGVNIHLSDCANLAHLSAVHPNRIVEVNWSDSAQGIFSVQIAIQAYDRNGILRDISQVLANEKITINQIDIEQNTRQQIVGTLQVNICDMSQLSRAIDRLAQIKDVEQVRRVSQ